ncbi:MAG: FAD-dependent oxidoreductase [Desulfobacteraceae bacterium]|jgi:succinate dehydrogenase/fumarate reductase flavoprotein subunit
MTLDKLADKIYETDVLVIGGGLSGCVAAIKSAKLGAKVIVVDKGKIERSGSAGAGMDHCATVPNENITYKDICRQMTGEGIYPPIKNKKGLFNTNMYFSTWEHTRAHVEEMESWGINLKWEDDEHYWIYSGRTGGRTTIRFHGQHLKPQLANAVRKSGCTVLDRSMGVEVLMKNGRAVGAICVNVRSGDFIVIKAKATVMGTGMAQRIFNPEDMAPWTNKMMYHWCPAGSGDAHAMTYRAGGKLANMEFSSWFSRLLDDKTLMFGSLTDGDGRSTPIVNAKGEQISETAFMSLETYLDQEEKGLTPMYFDVQENPEEDQLKREISTSDERMATIKFVQERNFDPRKHRWELHGTKSLALTKNMTGVVTDENFETTVPNLYVVGDAAPCGGTVLGAANSGIIFGSHIAKKLQDIMPPEVDTAQVKIWRDRTDMHKNVQDGAAPMEFETKIRMISERYATLYRTEGKLKEALFRLHDVRRDWLHRLSGDTPHNLMRVFDCYNLADIAEVHYKSALNRRDTRASFWRKDYPEMNPEWDGKVNFAYMKDGKCVIEVGSFPPLDPKWLDENLKPSVEPSIKEER